MLILFTMPMKQSTSDSRYLLCYEKLETRMIQQTQFAYKKCIHHLANVPRNMSLHSNRRTYAQEVPRKVIILSRDGGLIFCWSLVEKEIGKGQKKVDSRARHILPLLQQSTTGTLDFYCLLGNFLSSYYGIYCFYLTLCWSICCCGNCELYKVQCCSGFNWNFIMCCFCIVPTVKKHFGPLLQGGFYGLHLRTLHLCHICLGMVYQGLTLLWSIMVYPLGSSLQSGVRSILSSKLLGSMLISGYCELFCVGCFTTLYGRFFILDASSSLLSSFYT